MNDRVYQLLLVLVSTVVGAVGASIPGMLRGWRNDVKAEGASAAELATLQRDFGKLEQRVGDLSGDFEAFTEGTRKRFERIERKEQALEQHVTGKMPRISGEGPTNG